MKTYIILNQFSPEAFDDRKQLRELVEKISARTKRDCSVIRWNDRYATRGRFDVISVVEAQNPKETEKVAMTIRGFDHSTTETRVATLRKEVHTALRFRTHFSVIHSRDAPARLPRES